MNALAGSTGLVKGNASHGSFGFFFNFRLAFAAAAPPGKGETLFYSFLELFVGCGFECVGVSKGQRAVVERLLNFFKQLGDARGQTLLRDERLSFFPGAVTAREHHRAFGYVFRANLETQRHTAHFPIVKLESGTDSFAFIHFHADACRHQLFA